MTTCSGPSAIPTAKILLNYSLESSDQLVKPPADLSPHTMSLSFTFRNTPPDPVNELFGMLPARRQAQKAR